ncbi:MAG: hypothetical protein ACI82F_004702 [Planctomycetota bacterium]|jgi:hypothetical protein
MASAGTSRRVVMLTAGWVCLASAGLNWWNMAGAGVTLWRVLSASMITVIGVTVLALGFRSNGARRPGDS